MKFWKVILVFVIVIICITSCSKPSLKEKYYNAHKEIMKIESYETTAIIYDPNNSKDQVYKFKQVFKYPNKYRLEVIKPESLAGNNTMYNGKTAWIQHNAINQIWKMDDFNQSQEQLMFIGYFLQNYINSQNTTHYSHELKGKNSIVITTELPGGNPNLFSQSLWINEEDFTPLKLDIKDNKENVKFEVYYEDFKLNPVLEESLFYLND